MSDTDNELKEWVHLIVLCVVALVVLVGIGWGITAGFQFYGVWHAEMGGRAEFARAEGNRRITVLEAQAKLDSAKALAAAEVERAKGVAEANRIIGTSLEKNEAYLRWLWISTLDNHANNQVIYIPTEANLPILEAARIGGK